MQIVSLIITPCTAWTIIVDNPQINWDWYEITKHKNIDWNIINNNPNYPWVIVAVSLNPNITLDIIINNPDNQWNWYCISSNPNITMDIIIDNPDKPWDWNFISMNPFTKEKEQFINRRYREYMAAYKIQQWWKERTLSPHYEIGRKLIYQKYIELFE